MLNQIPTLIPSAMYIAEVIRLRRTTGATSGIFRFHFPHLPIMTKLAGTIMIPDRTSQSSHGAERAMYLLRHSHCDDVEVHRRSFEESAPATLPKAEIVHCLEIP